MADGRRREAWERHSFLLAMIRNQHCTKKNQLKAPRDFNPYEQKRRPRGRNNIRRGNIGQLKVFVTTSQRKPGLKNGSR